MRHFLGLTVPVVGLAEGMVERTLWSLLIACPGRFHGLGTGNRRTVRAIAITTVAAGTKIDLTPAPTTQKKPTRRLTHPAPAATRI
jgi:hypothetical protein